METIISHNMSAIMQLCNRGILIENGSLKHAGNLERVVSLYQETASTGSQNPIKDFPSRTGSGKIQIEELSIYNEEGQPFLYTGCTAKFRFKLKTQVPYILKNLHVAFGINDVFGQRLATFSTHYDPVPRNSNQQIEDSVYMTCVVPRLLFRPGSYFLSLFIDLANEVTDRIKDAIRIEIAEVDFFRTGYMPNYNQGPMVLDQSWQVSPVSQDVEVAPVVHES